MPPWKHLIQCPAHKDGSGNPVWIKSTVKTSRDLGRKKDVGPMAQQSQCGQRMAPVGLFELALRNDNKVGLKEYLLLTQSGFDFKSRWLR